MPMPVEQQVVIIYAGTSGALDDLPVKSVLAFEQAFLEYIGDSHPEVLEELRTKRTLSDAAKKTLDAAIQVVKKEFVKPDPAAKPEAAKEAPKPAAKAAKPEAGH